MRCAPAECTVSHHPEIMGESVLSVVLRVRAACSHWAHLKLGCGQSYMDEFTVEADACYCRVNSCRGSKNSVKKPPSGGSRILCRGGDAGNVCRACIRRGAVHSTSFRLTKELEAAKLKYQLALERHEGELADLRLGSGFLWGPEDCCRPFNFSSELNF